MSRMVYEFPLDQADVRERFDNQDYQQARAYFNARYVLKLERSTDSGHCEAIVRGSLGEKYDVQLDWDEYGEYVDTYCNCPAFDVDSECTHIVTVMLALIDQDTGLASETMSQKKAGRSSSFLSMPMFGGMPASAIPGSAELENRYANQFLQLFAPSGGRGLRAVPTAANGDELAVIGVEFIVKATLESHRYASLIEIELKVGPKRLYVVPKIREFLDNMEQCEINPFSKSFTFNPNLHRFREEDEEVLRALAQIRHSEEFFTGGRASYYYDPNKNHRVLRVPPGSWEALRDKLGQVNATLEIDGQSCGPLPSIEPSMLSLSFDVGQAPNKKAYSVKPRGLDRIGLLSEYGLAVENGKLVSVNPDELRHLSAVKSWFEMERRSDVVIPPAKLSDFLERALPSLRKLGRVHIEKSLEERIVQPELKAKLYLDYKDESLHTRLEFDYGGQILVQTRKGTRRKEPSEASDIVLVRNLEREAQLTALLDASPWAGEADDRVLANEDDIYDFLYNRIPVWEKQAEVFATTAVRTLLQPMSQRPRASVDVDSSYDWLEIRFDMEGIDEREIRRILQSLVEKRRYYRLPSGAFLSLEQEEFREAASMMSDMDIRKSEIKGSRIQLPAVRGLRMSDRTEPGHGSLRIKWGSKLRQLLERMRNPADLEHPLPDSLGAILRDYQKEGFQWLKTLSFYRFGGILADDMGLGKTLQSIAYMVSEREEQQAAAGERRPSLVVCPASLVYNWESEIRKFAPQLRTSVVAGAKAEREGMLEQDIDSAVDVIITSYPLLRRDIEFYEGKPFGILILDEAQAFKNRSSQTAQTLKRVTAGRRFALTGTPIENRLGELWSIFDVVFPGLFESEKAFTAMAPDKIARIIRPFVLRRMKSEVLTELPEKIESVLYSELAVSQKKIYAAYLEKLRSETEETLQANGFQQGRMKILAGLTRLRQICCHPALFVEDYKGESGKLEQLLETVEECLDNGRRLLIFSQFTSMLEMIRGELAAAGRPCFYLDGSTPSAERLQLCDRFNSGENDIFLISLKAGGTGLNLTGADTVILFDLWWNPAVEQQAADRAYRIGQKKVVQVMRLVTQGTIEEKIYELQQRKKDIANEVIQSGEASLSSLSEEDIRELLAVPV
ncbi:DEAD/DEAH box helicase [Cohnella fermenti]|uniref:Helicase SNF n=1 Tax=Cohnella fermenti TaxID=2565925 RepID=A0A4S4C1D8_9BACL|nr:DEAD/DEAH box helicase [Cohnella fermenti]THF80774.1 helicase SNF [Cohnella fermenti]